MLTVGFAKFMKLTVEGIKISVCTLVKIESPAEPLQTQINAKELPLMLVYIIFFI